MSKASSYVPEKGDIIKLYLDSRTGREQSGWRPAMVLSTNLFSDRTGLAVICPITSKIKGLPFEIALEGCKTKGVVLPIHIRSVDVRARQVTFIEKAPLKVQKKVGEYVEAIHNSAY